MNLTRPNSSSSSAKLFIPITPIVLVVCFLVCQFTPSRGAASVVIDIDQIGSDVVATGSGTLNLSGLTYVKTQTANAQGIQPSVGYILMGLPGSIDIYRSISGPSSWGSGFPTASSTETGNTLALVPGQETVSVPKGYVSGTLLTSSATWDSATFSSLGLNPGTYTYTWGSGVSADSLTVQVGPLATVPEPATIWLAAIGAAGFAACVRFTRSKKQRMDCQAGLSRAAE